MMLLLSMLKEVLIEFTFGMSKDDAINMTNNASLTEKMGTL